MPGKTKSLQVQLSAVLQNVQENVKGKKLLFQTNEQANSLTEA